MTVFPLMRPPVAVCCECLVTFATFKGLLSAVDTAMHEPCILPVKFLVADIALIMLDFFMHPLRVMAQVCILLESLATEFALKSLLCPMSAAMCLPLSFAIKLFLTLITFVIPFLLMVPLNVSDETAFLSVSFITTNLRALVRS